MGLPEGLGGRGLGGDVGPVAEHKHGAFFLQGVVFGPTIPENADPILQGGTSVANPPDVNGNFLVPFKRPFPNGVGTIVVVNGDAGVGGGIICGVFQGLISKSDFWMHVSQHDGTPYTSIVRVNWIAVGW